jgi:branched-chain amino acid transport system substrate-binding protein
MKRIRVVMLLLLSFVVVLSGCGQSASGPSGSSDSGNQSGTPAPSTKEAPAKGENVKIGIALPLTGPAALYGTQAQEGGQLAAEMINASGGILGGRQIELLFEDDTAKPEVGVQAYSKLIDRDNVDAVSGGVNSSVSMATKEVAKDKILNVVTISKAPDVMDDRDPYRFRLNSTNDMDGALFHEFIKTTLKPKTVAIIAENTDYGQAEIEALQANWSGADAPKIVATEYFELTETDYTNSLTKLRAAEAEALYVVGSAIEVNSGVFKQAYQLGFKDKMKLLAPGNLNTKFDELAGPGAEGVISADLYLNTLDNPMNKEFVAAFEKKFNYQPEKIQVLGFEAVWLIAKAMDEAGSSSDYQAISDIIAGKEWDMPRGKVKYVDGQALGDVAPLLIKDGNIISYK